MFQGFIHFPEFTEFPFNLGKTPLLTYVWSSAQDVG